VLSFHWFLPTNGDGRDIVGGGHGVSSGTAGVSEEMIRRVRDGRITEYASLGISEFILSGYPHLEEAYWFGEGVLPIVRERGSWRPPVGPGDDGIVNEIPFAATTGPVRAAS